KHKRRRIGTRKSAVRHAWSFVISLFPYLELHLSPEDPLMGRGSQSQTQQLTDQQLASINALNQNLLGQQQSLGNQLAPQFQSIANNPGLSPADKAAVTSQSQGTLASAFDSLQQSAANRAARTRNSAGFSDLTDNLARQKGVAEGNQAQQNQLAFS